MPTFSYIYSLPYILLLLSYFLLFLWENKHKRNTASIKNIRICCIALFLVFFGLRGYLYTDYLIYYPIYKDTPTIWNFHDIVRFFSLNNDLSITRIEPGFKVYLILFKSISSNYFFLQFGSSLIDVLFLNYFFKKYSPIYTLSFILFFVFGGLTLEINLLRNIKAVFIFLFALQYLKERKAIPYFICCTIALLFHSSAIFYFPLYFFLHKKIPSFVIWIAFVVENIVYLLQLKFMSSIATVALFLGGPYSTMLDNYSNIDLYNSSYGISIGYIGHVATYILLFANYKKINEYVGESMETNIFYNLFFIFFTCYTCLSEFSVFTDRITPLFICSYWILYPYFYETSKVLIRKIFTIVLLIFSLMKLYVGNSNILSRYENVLWGTKTINQANSILTEYYYKISRHK